MFFKKSCLRPLNTLVWDSYECCMEESIKSTLHAKKIESIVPRECTKYIQALDVRTNHYNWFVPTDIWGLDVFCAPSGNNTLVFLCG